MCMGVHIQNRGLYNNIFKYTCLPSYLGHTHLPLSSPIPVVVFIFIIFNLEGTLCSNLA